MEKRKGAHNQKNEANSLAYNHSGLYDVLLVTKDGFFIGLVLM